MESPSRLRREASHPVSVRCGYCFRGRLRASAYRCRVVPRVWDPSGRHNEHYPARLAEVESGRRVRAVGCGCALCCRGRAIAARDARFCRSARRYHGAESNAGDSERHGGFRGDPTMGCTSRRTVWLACARPRIRNFSATRHGTWGGNDTLIVSLRASVSCHAP